MKKIPVFFTFDDNFLVPAIVTIYSLLKNTNRQYFYKLYVVYSDLSQVTINKLAKVIIPFKDYSSIEFIKVDSELFIWNNLKSKCHYSKEIYNKLIASSLFPQYDKILCSDVDVVFTGDISDSYLHYQDHEDFYIAGVNSVFKPLIIEKYVNFSDKEKEIISKGVGAGYLLMNLKKMREEHLQEKMISFYKENLYRLIQPEQDVLNLCSTPYIEYLPYKYLICVGDYQDYKNKDLIKSDLFFPISTFESALKNPVQLHYAGFFKPWNSFFSKKQNIWFQYLFESGSLFDFLKKFPYFMYRRSKNYSLKRFFHKAYNRFIK